MSLSAREIELVVEELQPLAGAFVQKIYVPAPRTVLFEVRRPGASYLLKVCADTGRTRLHLAESRPASPEPPYAFQGLLRAQVLGTSLAAIQTTAGERQATLHFRGEDLSLALVAELTGRHGNLFLVDEGTGLIRGSAVPNLSQRRDNRPGKPYIPPFARSAVPPGDRQTRFVSTDEPFSISRAIARLYEEREATENAMERRRDLVRDLRARRQRLARTVERVREDVERTGRAEEHRVRGELLKANLGRIRRGMREARLISYTEKGVEEVTIRLDPSRSTAENLEREFHQYRRLLAGQERSRARLAQVMAELEEVDRKIAKVETSSDEDLPSLPLRRPAAPGMRRAPAARPFREYLSSSGQRIRVGRGAKENDALTFRHSKGNDVWLHVRGQAGAHVVIPLARDEAPGEQTLRDAALLAGHHSETRGMEVVEVAWTRVKYVRKVHGGPPGAVTYSQEKTLAVRPEPERLARILESLEQNASSPDGNPERVS
jgi:predicted ribosome quality control (RQC) complex YloA/Tae2 family protein